MSDPMERRNFLGIAVTSVIGARLSLDVPRLSTAHQSLRITDVPSAAVNPTFPRQDAAMVQEFVGAAHRDLARVTEMLDAHPALAKASVDWGFGDWEDALGGASHTGRVEIAELLLARGARPTIFSAAMLGQLEPVKAFIAAEPGYPRILGPHGITLLAHARAGGERAKTTLAYLEQRGDADIPPPAVALDATNRERYVGTYAFGAAENENVQVAVAGAAGLSITRPGLPSARGMKHLGNHEFSPAGAEFVRLRFTVVADKATKLEVLDPFPMITALRRD